MATTTDNLALAANNTATAPDGTLDKSSAQEQPAAQSERPTVAVWQINVLGVMLILLSAAICYMLYVLWPGTQAELKQTINSCFFNERYLCFTFTAEQRVLVLVLLAGALGSCIHGISSFSNFVGQGKIERSWVWWYIARPFIGMGLAFVFYVIFRGGFLNQTQVSELNIYSVLTLSILAGLFTDRATLKLEEIFQSIFQPKDERKDKLNNGQK